MFKVVRENSPNKMRDIDITLAYHNTGKTLEEVADRFFLSHETVRKIHNRHVTNILRQLDKYTGIEEMYGYHTDETRKYLQQYKDFLIDEGID